jgi:hypothetical protein
VVVVVFVVGVLLALIVVVSALLHTDVYDVGVVKSPELN